ncbi:MULTISPECIES: YcaO-like family protein [Amycolatopsis]|uniref:YcaO-like family protein n=2 Tax=Amycolatopsis TaxID=1813 RepID=A0ABW5I602_9PSEU
MTAPSQIRPGLADIVDRLVDPRVGVVASVSEVHRDPGAPDFFHYGALAANTGPLTGRNNFRSTGGAAATRQDAVAKAVGEAVERYCSAWYELDQLPLTSAASAGFPCVAPEEFALYDPAQFAWPDFAPEPFTEDTVVRWTPMTDFHTGRRVHVPAARVYMPYFFYTGSGDAPICQPISTGLACHGGWSRAALAAVCEVVERDAITIAWQAMLSPPQIMIETLPDELYDLVARFERAAAEVTLFDLTLDHGVPVVLAALRSRHSGGPALVVAGSAAVDAHTAVRKALEELAHTRRYSQLIYTRLPRLRPDPPLHRTVTGQREHLNFWADHANLPLADFLFAGKQRSDFEDLPDLGTGDAAGDLDTVCARVAAAGERVLLADLTTPDVGELGLSVVRAVVPGMHPLQLGHGLRALGGHRLRTVPQTLGHPGLDPAAGDNPAPHPYP